MQTKLLRLCVSDQTLHHLSLQIFWTAPMTGTDDPNRVTLIHEMSHFNVVASTQDYV
jgi:hypothetical protein